MPAVRFDFGSIGIYPPPAGAAPQNTIPIGAETDPAERAADRIASGVLRSGAPGSAPGPLSAPRPGAGEPLPAALRAFFEPRFGVDLAAVRVHRDGAAAASAARIGARAYTLGADIVYGPGARPGADALTAHELAHAVQGAGDRAAPVVRRAPRADGPLYRIISDIWRVAGRDIVIVETGAGVRRAFYRRTGLGDKGVGAAPQPGNWAPFKGLEPQAANPTKPWFNKTSYYRNIHPDNPLRGYGNTLNRDIAGWLDNQYITRGQPKNWEVVRQEMDSVMHRPSLAPMSPPAVSVSGEIGGKPGGGAPAKAEGAAGKIESAAGKAETTAGKAELKALAAEGGAAELATAAAKGGRLARLGKFLLAAAMPGPLDVLFLYIGFFGSIAEAKAKLRQEFYALGFAEGLSANLLGIPRARAMEMLVTLGGRPGIGERVAGFEGVRDRASNSGAIDGFKFALKLTNDQRIAFLKEGFATVAGKGHTVGPDFGRDDAIELGIALKPVVVDLLELAAEQELRRRTRAMVEAMYEDTESMWQK